MSETAQRNRVRTTAEPARGNATGETASATSTDTEELLSILSDDSAREILVTISDEPLSAREIADLLDLSRPTVYRRLNRLEDLGVLSTSLAYDPDGHHRQQFQATPDRVVVSLDAEEIAVKQATSVTHD